jgi:prophage antirepressor-like protein
MKNSLQIFTTQEFGQVRTVKIDDKLYFVGTDIAKALEYNEPHKAVKAHCRDGGISYPVTDSLGRQQETKIILEGDVYRLIVKAATQSKNPEIKAKADRFERYIFDEVVPTVLKYGMYATEELMNNPEFMIQVFTRLKEEQEKNKTLTAQIEKDKPLLEFAEQVQVSHNTILIRELAKLASKNGLEIGQNRLYEKLRSWGLILKNSLEPFQEYVKRGYFEVEQQVVEGKPFTDRTTRVTGRGQVYIINRLKRELPCF